MSRFNVSVDVSPVLIGGDLDDPVDVQPLPVTIPLACGEGSVTPGANDARQYWLVEPTLGVYYGTFLVHSVQLNFSTLSSATIAYCALGSNNGGPFQSTHIASGFISPNEDVQTDGRATIWFGDTPALLVAQPGYATPVMVSVGDSEEASASLTSIRMLVTPLSQAPESKVDLPIPTP